MIRSWSFRRSGPAELPTYNHLRRFVTALVEAGRRGPFSPCPKKEELEVVSRWEKTLDAVTGLIVKSFAPDDCQVLARVFQGNAQANVLKIDLIVKHLNDIKKALLENASRQEVRQITKAEGDGLCQASS